MDTPNTLYAGLIAVACLVALVLGVRAYMAGARRRGTGWVVLAVAGLLQGVNLVSGYSVLLSVLTTVGLGVGVWMVTRHDADAARPV